MFALLYSCTLAAFVYQVCTSLFDINLFSVSIALVLFAPIITRTDDTLWTYCCLSHRNQSQSIQLHNGLLVIISSVIYDQFDRSFTRPVFMALIVTMFSIFISAVRMNAYTGNCECARRVCALAEMASSNTSEETEEDST